MKHMEDLVRSTVRRLPVDKRFKVHGPIVHPHDDDILNVFLDYEPSRLTCVVELHKSQMRSFTEQQLVKYVEMQMLFADDQMRERVTTTRRTTMLFTAYPPTTKVRGWLEYMERFQQDMTFALWCRVVRKTPRERIRDCRVECRQLKPKWHDRSGVTGVIEATAIWEDMG